MRSGYATAVVLVSLALISIVGWAASRTPASSVPQVITATTKPAPPPPPACVPGQLSSGYLTERAAGDHNFGIIAIWDRSARPCTLTGPIVVSGLDPAGHVMTTVLTYEVTVASALNARGTRPGADLQLTAGQHVAPLMVSAGYKTDALSQYRPCRRQTEPATWRLKFTSGGALTVANADPHGSVRGGRGLPANHGLLTCRGVLDAAQSVEVVSAG